MTRGGLLGLVMALVVTSVASAAERPARGRVTYVAKGRAYLDVGSADGLTLGDALPVRGNAPCRIVELAQHFAACAGGRVEVGLHVSVPRAVVEVERAPPTDRPRPWKPERVKRAQRALLAARFQPVPYRGGTTGQASALRAAAALGHKTWAYADRPAQGFDAERVRVVIDSMNAGVEGLRLRARVDAVHWTRRPSTTRFRPGVASQLYVWEASAGYRPRDGGAVAMAGRILPWRVPGLGLVDGAQVGWQSRRRDAEAGVYGGGIPDPVTLAPRTDVWTLGAYATHDVAIGSTLLRPTLRAGLAQLADRSQRVVAALDAEARLPLGAHLTSQVRAGADAQRIESAALDGWYVQLEARPAEPLDVFASVRELRGFAELGDDIALDRGPSRRADLGGQLHLLGWLTVAASGGMARDEGGDDQAYAGPELRVGEVLPWRTTAALGWIADFGSMPGDSLYLQATSAPGDRLELWSRVGVSQSRGDSRWRELTVWLATNVRLAAWLDLRVSATGTYGRLGLAATETPLAGMGLLELVASD